MLHTVERYGSEDWLTENIYPKIRDSVPRFEWVLVVINAYLAYLAALLVAYTG